MTLSSEYSYMPKLPIDLTNLTDEEILNLRIRDLPISIKGTWIEKCIEELYRELHLKGIGFKPPCYLADEWLTPDNEPVIGIAFFLAHPKLIRLEDKIMLEVEGGTKSWCLKLLRHETGHALNYAYKLYRRKKWQEVFGNFSKEYTDTYRFRPYSKSFVRHLEDYYAQYHPDEDFAETFAVWLDPHSDWKNQYKGWKALNKLNYVDKIISEVKNKPPLIPQGKKYWQASKLKTRIKNYYKKKREFWAEYFPDFHDSNLKKIFSSDSSVNKGLIPAVQILKKYRKNILDSVSLWTGEKKYVIDNLLKTLSERCKDLNLTANEPETNTCMKVSIYTTVLIMNYLHTGRFRKKKWK